MESWIEPSYPDLEKIKEEISMLQKEVEILKAHQAQLPGKGLFSHSSRSGETSTTASQSLARKSSVAGGGSSIGKDPSRLKEFDALLAPFPRMMPITEMHDKAMQAHNARRKEIEEALQAQRQAKEEEERIERERIEAEEAAKRAIEEEARQKERKEREAKEEEERRQQQQLREKEEKAVAGNQRDAAPFDADMVGSSVPTRQSQDQQATAQAGQYDQAGGRQVDSTNNTSGNNSVYGEDANRSENGLSGVGGGNGGDNYFDDSYNLLMDNFNMYENNGTGFTMPGDEMMDDSLFTEYMDQMGSM